MALEQTLVLNPGVCSQKIDVFEEYSNNSENFQEVEPIREFQIQIASEEGNIGSFSSLEVSALALEQTFVLSRRC